MVTFQKTYFVNCRTSEMNEARYCKSCGAYIPENKDRCVACGNPWRTNRGGSGGTGGSIPPSRLDDNKFCVYIDGKELYRTVRQCSQSQAPIMKPKVAKIDLDSGLAEVKCAGHVREGYITHVDYMPPINAGRTIDGRLQRCGNDMMEVRLFLQLK